MQRLVKEVTTAILHENKLFPASWCPLPLRCYHICKFTEFVSGKLYAAWYFVEGHQWKDDIMYSELVNHSCPAGKDGHRGTCEDYCIPGCNWKIVQKAIGAHIPLCKPKHWSHQLFLHLFRGECLTVCTWLYPKEASLPAPKIIPSSKRTSDMYSLRSMDEERVESEDWISNFDGGGLLHVTSRFFSAVEGACRVNTLRTSRKLWRRAFLEILFCSLVTKRIKCGWLCQVLLFASAWNEKYKLAQKKS